MNKVQTKGTRYYKESKTLIFQDYTSKSGLQEVLRDQRNN